LEAQEIAMVLNNSSTSATDDSIAVTNYGSGATIKIIKNSAEINSLLNPLIAEIVNRHSLDYSSSSRDELPPDTEDKIKYNSVKIFAEDIRENAGFMVLVEDAINNIDDLVPNAKTTFLWAIKRKYNKIKKGLFLENSIDPGDIEAKQKIISSNADNILNEVSQEIAAASSSLEFPIELLDVARELIVFYGFINCKILEKPPV